VTFNPIFLIIDGLLGVSLTVWMVPLLTVDPRAVLSTSLAIGSRYGRQTVEKALQGMLDHLESSAAT
jgi:hypothetical protein